MLTTWLAWLQLHYAHEAETVQTLKQAIEKIKPTGLIGVSTQVSWTGLASRFSHPSLHIKHPFQSRPLIINLTSPDDPPS